jgi:ABC-type transporter Mla subunit MlaD
VRIALAATVAVLALVAGCGGSDEGNATEQWASGVCSALQTWSESVQGAATSLQDTSSISPDSISTALNSVIDATSTLATDVKTLGRPDTESGQQAQETLTQLATTLEGDAAELQKLLDTSGGAGLGGVLDQLGTVTKTLGSMASAVGQTFDDLQQLDVKGDLQDAFESAGSCSSLVGSS